MHMASLQREIQPPLGTLWGFIKWTLSPWSKDSLVPLLEEAALQLAPVLAFLIVLVFHYET